MLFTSGSSARGFGVPGFAIAPLCMYANTHIYILYLPISVYLYLFIYIHAIHLREFGAQLRRPWLRHRPAMYVI